jgi:hypothetical protein
MRLSWLRRQFGGPPVSVLALTLLVLGCVLVAVAGPRYSLHSRTPGAPAGARRPHLRRPSGPGN